VHHTTEVPSTDKIEVSVPVAALRAILPTLKRVAAHSRFGADYPVVVSLGPGTAVFAAVTPDVHVGYAWRTAPAPPVMWQGMISWANLSTVAEEVDESVVIKPVDGQVTVGGKAAPPVTLPAEEWMVRRAVGPVYPMRLPPSSAFLLKAMAGPVRARLLPYALLEVPAITLVTTDAQRLHVQYALDETDGPQAPVESRVLLTKEQLTLLLEDLTDKAIQRIEDGCRVSGRQHEFYVEMAFRTATTPAMPFPEWRQFVTRRPQLRYPMAAAALRGMVAKGGPIRLPNGPILDREYVRDALVDWEGPQVTIGVVSSHAPAIFYGHHRAAVIMYATELQESAPAAPAAEAPNEQGNDAETAPGQTSASPATPLFRAGDVMDGPEGPLQIVKAQVWCLVQLPTGKKQWFTAPGLTAYLGGEAVAA
jgi:hypothetical protein